ncbi:hypothetical protein BPC006_I3902 [Burkholderia pseudomallei BPC006]|nr:conserved hypothetical protein [Burkholderia pseudomallei MSHR346]AFR17726.1 hypothetical protein BPC006_I3902 [Burkholderia pseudomallei BPC006]
MRRRNRTRPAARAANDVRARLGARTAGGKSLAGRNIVDDRCRARLNFLNEANRSERPFSRHALDSRFMPVKCPKSTVPQGDLLRAYGNA